MTKTSGSLSTATTFKLLHGCCVGTCACSVSAGPSVPDPYTNFFLQTTSISCCHAPQTRRPTTSRPRRRKFFWQDMFTPNQNQELALQFAPWWSAIFLNPAHMDRHNIHLFLQLGNDLAPLQRRAHYSQTSGENCWLQATSASRSDPQTYFLKASQCGEVAWAEQHIHFQFWRQDPTSFTGHLLQASHPLSDHFTHLRLPCFHTFCRLTLYEPNRRSHAHHLHGLTTKEKLCHLDTYRQSEYWGFDVYRLK